MNNHDHFTINSDYPYIYIHTLLAGASYPPFLHSRISIISSSVKLRGIPLRGGSCGGAPWPLFLILCIIVEIRSCPWLSRRRARTGFFIPMAMQMINRTAAATLPTTSSNHQGYPWLSWACSIGSFSVAEVE